MPTNPVVLVLLFLLTLPVIVGIALFFVFLVVDFSRRRLGDTKVEYRPFRTRFADWLLILRLWLRRGR